MQRLRATFHCCEVSPRVSKTNVLKLRYAVSELEPLEHVLGVFRKLAQVGHPVLANVLLACQQAAECEFAGAVKGLFALGLQVRVQVDASFLALGVPGLNVGFCAFKHAVQTPQQGEGEDDFAVTGLLVIAPEEVGDRPQEVCEFGEVLSHKWILDYIRIIVEPKLIGHCNVAGELDIWDSDFYWLA